MKKYPYFLVITLFAAILACKKDPPVEPVPVTLGLRSLNAPEGNASNTLQIEARLSAAATEIVSADFSLTGVSAEAGKDFEDKTGTVTFQIGETSKKIEVTALGDAFREGDETFDVQLKNMKGATPYGAAVRCTLQNDDVALRKPAGYETPTAYSGYDLVWADEFSGSTLDPAAWNYEIGDGCPGNCGWGNNELEWYTNDVKNTYLREDCLVIEARKENIGTKNYSSARLTTEHKKKFKYGRIDIRAVLPTGKGIWPAFWMLSNDFDSVSDPWPRTGEIDILEMVGKEPNVAVGTVHYGASFAAHQYTSKTWTLPVGEILHDKFHVFSIVWAENQIEWFVDDQLFHTFTPADAGGAGYPFNDSEFFLIFNLAVGGNWPGPPDDTTAFPNLLVVDYVRVFQKQ